MTPKERVLAVIDGQEIFHVPVDVFENGVHPELCSKVLRHFGLADGDKEGLLRALGACIRWGRPLYVGPPLEEDTSGVLVPTYPAWRVVKDIWGSWGECPGTYYDGLPRPLRSAETVADVEAHRWPDPNWFDYEMVGWIRDLPRAYLPLAQWARLNSDYARLAGGWSPIFSRIMDLFGIETGLAHVADRPELIEATVAHIADFYEEYYGRLARAARGHFEILAWGDDFAGQQGLLLRPTLWRKWFLPVWKRLFAIAHRNGLKAALHSCGSVRAILGDLGDVGLDILENVQVKAVGMDPAELKREFGKHLTFYGGIDTQEILPQGSPQDVRREVRRLIDILGKGGRFIFCTVHYLLDDVPAENALAMYDEANSYCP
jgi:uroporphyrinogen decarboxylase